MFPLFAPLQGSFLSSQHLYLNLYLFPHAVVQRAPSDVVNSEKGGKKRPRHKPNLSECDSSDEVEEEEYDDNEVETSDSAGSGCSESEDS